MSKAVAALALCCLFLTACSKYKADGGKDGQSFAPDPARAFTVSAVLTDRAAAKMKALGDNLVIDTSYYGYPTDAARPKANSLQQIDLGQEKIVVSPPAYQAHMLGRMNSKGVTDITGDVMVLVNGYSVTPVGAKDDQISCGYYRARIELPQAKAPVLQCDIETP
ncbi:MAG: hypothetical protein QM647_03675 [Asticcacaulis sp.]|uniref:hypothetical protein n=1 Tax=Asticcacaulis sp. TaxID=1872648 RepID=UPI0039E26FAC